MRHWLWWLGAVSLLLSVGCSGNDTPAVPSAPLIPQVAGLWQTVGRLSGASGGECVGSLFQASIGTPFSSTIAVSQSGSVLNATATSQSTGTSCTLAGTIGGNGAFVLNTTSCQAGSLYGVQCQNGSRRDVILLASAVNGMTSTLTNSTSASGTEADTYNVYVAGTTAGVGVLVLNSTFTMTR
jgi:hypothetical protein